MDLKEAITMSEQCAGLLVADLRQSMTAAGKNRLARMLIADTLEQAVKLHQRLELIESEVNESTMLIRLVDKIELR